MRSADQAMPELPEVETIKNELAPLLTGRRIKSVEFLWAKTLLSPSIPEFEKRVKGKKLESLDRRGKYLIWRLEGGDSILVHLRMTGSFLVSRSKELPDSHTRAIVHLDDGQNVYYVDPRKFGKFQLVTGDEWEQGKLGVEPLSDEFTSNALAHLLKRRTAPIKSVLMEQNLVAGIGNMYADEALYEARIHPERPAQSLSALEVKNLHRAIRGVLKTAIKNKGASISNYFRPDGERGTAHEGFKVAHRRGEVCPVCGGPVERIVVRQRGTYFCPACQR
jgi:formamidopyrimidine-DNA glycosylase